MTQAATSQDPRLEPARRFFLERIEREAAQEGKPLSDAEAEFLRRMAYVEGKEHEKLEKAVGGDDAVASLCERAADLLERSLRNESACDPNVLALYKENLERVEEEDLMLAFIVGWAVKPKATKALGYTLQFAYTIGGVLFIALMIFLIIRFLRQ